MRNGHPGFGTEPFTPTMSATFLFFVPPDCRFAFGREGVKDHARPAGSKKHRCFAVQSNTSRRGSPVRRYRCFSLLSSAPPAAPNVVHEDAARWKKMPRVPSPSQSESDIRSMNLPAGGIGNRSENETSDWPHKDRLMEYRTCLWNKELYVKHGNLQRPCGGKR